MKSSFSEKRCYEIQLPDGFDEKHLKEQNEQSQNIQLMEYVVSYKDSRNFTDFFIYTSYRNFRDRDFSLLKLVRDRTACKLSSRKSSSTGVIHQVNDTPSTLNAPRGIEYDKYGNLYVCDRSNKRVVMYCVNSTMGRVVVADNAATVLQNPYDVAFDSDLNMYVLDGDGQRVIRYNRL